MHIAMPQINSIHIHHTNTIFEYLYFFFLNDTAPTEIYTLSLHDALPISRHAAPTSVLDLSRAPLISSVNDPLGDRKSTRLNSSHLVISYAVFCLKKKKKQRDPNSPIDDLIVYANLPMRHLLSEITHHTRT